MKHLSKNIIENSQITAGGDVHIGDIKLIIQNTSTTQIQLPSKLKILKRKLSGAQLQVLAASQTENTPLEEGVLLVLEKIPPFNIQPILLAYQQIEQMSWRKAVSIYQTIEPQIFILEDTEIASIYKLLLKPEMPIGQKLRASLPLISLIETTSSKILEELMVGIKKRRYD